MLILKIPSGRFKLQISIRLTLIKKKSKSFRDIFMPISSHYSISNPALNCHVNGTMSLCFVAILHISFCLSDIEHVEYDTSLFD